MKYRLITLLGLLALGVGSVIQAQDYDDIYYDAGKSTSTVKTKVEKPAKTVAVYSEVPENYKVIASSNYRVERDEDEYNRRGAYDPSNVEYEVDINGDTIYEEAFANTRRIERFYNPDIVVLSDDDDLVELYYDESPTINLIVGSDWGWGYSPYYYSWGIGSIYSPYWYDPWYGSGWYSSWYSPYYYYGYHWYGPRLWHWGYYRPWGYYGGPYGWDNYWGWNRWHGPGHGHRGGYTADGHRGWRDRGGRVSTGTNRNGHGSRPTKTLNGTTPRGTGGNGGTRVGRGGGGRSGVTTSSNGGNIGTRGGGNIGTRGGGNVGTRSGGNIGTRSGSGTTRGTSGVTTRQSSGVSRSGSSYGGNRSYSGGSSSRSSGSYSGGSSSRSSGSYSGGSRSSSSGSYSGGSRSSGGSYSGGSHSGGGSRGGSSGGGGRRR